MLFRNASPTLIGVAAMLAAGSALAASAKSEGPVVLASYYSMSDRVVDPVSESIRAVLINVDGQGAFIEKKNVGALTAFYRAQSYAPSWTMDGKLTDRALAVIARIKAADTDGLDPGAYRLPHAQIGLAMPATTEALARAEVMLSQAVADYVRDAHSGRLDPADVSQNFDYRAAHRRSGRGAEQDFALRRRSGDAGVLQSAASRVPGAARKARRGARRRRQPAAGRSWRPQPQARHEGPARGHPARAPEDRAAGTAAAD